MKHYDACLPEKKDWCVPAALQTVLKSRGIQINQKEIAPCFPRLSNGFEFNNGLLGKFLKKFNLGSEFYDPFSVPYGDEFNYKDIDRDLDSLMKEKERNLLTAYKKISGDHLAVVSRFKEGLIHMVGVEEGMPLSKLLESMPSNRYGFYAIN